ncbi:MAG: hypothetical protein LRY36_01590 [Alphaproteobacteria bacterium]|nr:hypothetical protein [Alphaproteobacteria bacterium]
MIKIDLTIRTAILIALSLTSSTYAQAQTLYNQSSSSSDIAETPCDDEYMKSLESRAWLEAQREITQNQNLIYKPDSVLAYTCFDKFANVTANMQSWQGFSESNRWGNVITPLTTAMDQALQPLVGSSLLSYLNTNFNNAYLSGRGPSSYKSGSISGGSYSCSEMNKVWELAKCYNFQTLPQDGFFTFEEHSKDDKRKLPQACTNPSEAWTKQIQASGLEPDTAPSWPFDKVEVYYDKLKPENCSSSTPLPTGVTVTSNTPGLPASWDEKICIIPGCYSDPNNGGQCTTSGN